MLFAATLSYQSNHHLGDRIHWRTSLVSTHTNLRKMQILLNLTHGSHLYGTNTATSDIDMKAIYLPSLTDLLLGKDAKTFTERPVGHNEKMIIGEVETQYIPLNKFLDDFYNGQTYAIELAFSPQQHEYSHEFTQLTSRFLNSNLKAMIGYAIAQSQKYGAKSQRHHEYTCIIAMIKLYNLDQTIADNPVLVAKLQTISNRVGPIIASDGMPMFRIINKSFPLNRKWNEVLHTLQNIVDGYGERTKEFSNSGTDWKALAHAVRIINQVRMLSTTGKLTFPLENRDYLKAIKAGAYTKEHVVEYMEHMLASVETISSVLPNRSEQLDSEFEQFKLEWMYKLYRIQP